MKRVQLIIIGVLIALWGTSWAQRTSSTAEFEQARKEIAAYYYNKGIEWNKGVTLNIGPRTDGTIPQGAQDVLLAVGRWLRVNGEDTR